MRPMFLVIVLMTMSNVLEAVWCRGLGFQGELKDRRAIVCLCVSRLPYESRRGFCLLVSYTAYLVKTQHLIKNSPGV